MPPGGFKNVARADDVRLQNRGPIGLVRNGPQVHDGIGAGDGGVHLFFVSQIGANQLLTRCRLPQTGEIGKPKDRISAA